MKNLSLLICILFSVAKISAQNRFGIEAGVLRSSIEIAGDTKLNSELKTGFKLGVFGDFPIFKKIYFSPALSLVNKGGKFDNTFMAAGDVWKSKDEYKTYFIELPLNILYKINVRKIKLLAGAGVVIGYGIGGKVKTEGTRFKNDGTSTQFGGETDIKFDGKKVENDSKMHFKPFEIGANAFVGVEVFNRIRIQFQYRPNFSDLSVNDGPYKNNEYYCLTVAGFVF